VLEVLSGELKPQTLSVVYFVGTDITEYLGVEISYNIRRYADERAVLKRKLVRICSNILLYVVVRKDK